MYRKFYHGMLKKKRRHMTIKGVCVDDDWVSHPHRVKDALMNFYTKKNDSFMGSRYLNHNPKLKSLNSDHIRGLDKLSALEEVCDAIWAYGSDKASGPNGFTFMFVKRFWDLMHSDVHNFVHFLG